MQGPFVLPLIISLMLWTPASQAWVIPFPILPSKSSVDKACRTSTRQIHHYALPSWRGNSVRSASEAREPYNNYEESPYVATCIPGLAKILAQELISIGANRVETTGNSAVTFTADISAALKVLIWSRTSHKVMELLCESSPQQPLENRNDLYQFVRDSIPIKQLLGDGRGGLLTLSVSTTLVNAAQLPVDINHSHYTALTIKNALCDAVRDLRGDRPNVDTENADVPLVAVLRGNKLQGGGASLSLFRQIHHGSLHRRGYRQSTIHKAAMKESLAAGLLLSAEWPQQVEKQQQEQKQDSRPLILVDPMAGSGTLLLEGIFMAANVAPHILRLKCGLDPVNAQQFPPITLWKHNYNGGNDNDDTSIVRLWKDLLLEASECAKTGLRNLRAAKTPIYFLANDVDPGALDLCQKSLQHAGVSDLVRVCEAWIVVCNPPWGVRLTEDMSDAWEALRFFLRDTCPEGTMAHILSGNPKATKHLGLRRSASLPIQVGQVEMRWITYCMQKPSSTRQSFDINTEDNEEDEPPAWNDYVDKRDRASSWRGRGEQDSRKPRPKKKEIKALNTTTYKKAENEWLVG